MADPRLIAAVEALIHAAERPGYVPLIGISGAQGAGKTTLARAAAEALGAARLSLDDVYLTRAGREALARAVHPLFVTRGPPGTHDLHLLSRAVGALRGAGPDDRTPLPAFDKLADDRRPEADWPLFEGRPRAILIDGWLLGAAPQDAAALAAPVNALERDEDPQGIWRHAANARLAAAQPVLTHAFDAILMLKAPSFERVLDWRCEQQAGLAPGSLPTDERVRLGCFVAHFERITRHMLAGGARAETVVRLGPDRGIHAIDTNPGHGR